MTAPIDVRMLVLRDVIEAAELATTVDASRPLTSAVLAALARAEVALGIRGQVVELDRYGPTSSLSEADLLRGYGLRLGQDGR